MTTTTQTTTKRDELILQNYHLVKAIAAGVQRSMSVHVEFDDLIHAGTMGLMDAAGKYQDDKEVPFPLYAKHRIKGAILDSLRQIDWASRDSRKLYRQIENVTRDLTAQLNRTPTQEEVMEMAGIDARRWQNLMIDYNTFGKAAASKCASEREGEMVREIPAAPSDCPQNVLARVEMRRKLDLALANLPERHQEVVKMYYEGDMTMKEIGTALGVNESRVCQIHKSALAKMNVVLGSTGVRSTAAFC